MKNSTKTLLIASAVGAGVAIVTTAVVAAVKKSKARWERARKCAEQLYEGVGGYPVPGVFGCGCDCEDCDCWESCVLEDEDDDEDDSEGDAGEANGFDPSEDETRSYEELLDEFVKKMEDNQTQSDSANSTSGSIPSGSYTLGSSVSEAK